MTDEEAELAYNEAEAVPMTREQIDKIVEFIVNPRRCVRCEGRLVYSRVLGYWCPWCDRGLKR